MSDKEQALERLHEMIKPGDTVFTILRHVSGSGMTRWVDVYTFDDGEPQYLSWLVAKATGEKVNQGNHDGIKVGGCGFDAGAEVVYDLGQALWPEGFECIGDKCPSNDHSNGDRDYTPGHKVHKAGGYALRQRWL